MLDFTQLAGLEINHSELTIRPYRVSDFAGLQAQFQQGFFKWFFRDYPSCADFVAEKQSEVAAGRLVFLVIIATQTQQIIGTSSLYEISLRHKRLELGSSWLGRGYQGRHFNALAKLLLIDTLISKFGFNRLQWKTDALNEQSKTAMLKLGFVYEGTLRRHAVTESGRVRDSLVFSVTDLDWPQTKLVIEARVAAKSVERNLNRLKTD